MASRGQADRPAQAQSSTAIPERPVPDANVSAQHTQAPTTTAPTQQHPSGDSLVLPNQDATFAALDQIANANSNGLFSGAGMPMPTNQTVAGPNGSTSAPGSKSGKDNSNNTISADEIALYDRQIRLWGMQAQQKIQSAHILLITMKALANEVAKNLVLAGIGSLTIVDDQVVTEADLGAQFCVSQENIGQNRAVAAANHIKNYNPRVKVYADPESIMNKGPSFFAGFDIVIATDLNPTLLAFINTATRLHNRQFYAAGTHGLYGYIFCDLIEHDYVLRRQKGNVTTTVGEESRTRRVLEVKVQEEGDKTVELVSKRDLYSTWDLVSETSHLPPEYLKSKRRLKAVTPALSCLRALWSFQQTHNRDPATDNKQDLEFFTRSATHNHSVLSLPAETLRSEFLRSFLQNIGSEIAPTTSILGGQLAQDVQYVLGQNQQPIQNMVIFDGSKMESNVYSLHPEGNLGRAQLELTNTIPLGPVDATQMLPPMDHQPGMMPGGTI
ncbi:hypothetical protein F5X96DRAFT_575698 [Biscogniauxia mediterranea]|nr:hypothetical protein F5X96DRAFT_575698 [Biscogniauxia mediterranea]